MSFYPHAKRDDGLPYNPRGHAIWLVCVITPFVSGIFIALRVYTRGFLVKSFKPSDYVSFATLGFCIGYSVLIAQATYTGMGLHTGQFTPIAMQHYYFWIMVASELYCLALAGYKTALLLLYLELFGINRKFKYACWLTLFIVNGYLFSNMVTEVAGCIPNEKFYNPKVPGHCIDYIKCDIAYGAFNMLTDLAIAILPIPLVWKLKLPSRREKIGLALVLTTGGIAFVVAVIRWVYGIVDLTRHSDYIAGLTFLWSILEVNTGLICGCTPSLKPLLKVAKEKKQEISRKRSSTKDRSTGTGSSGTSKKGSIISLFTKKPSRDETDAETAANTKNNSVSDGMVRVESAQMGGEDVPQLLFRENAFNADLPSQTEFSDYAFPEKDAEITSNSGDSSDRTTSESRPAAPRMTSDELFQGLPMKQGDSAV